MTNKTLTDNEGDTLHIIDPSRSGRVYMVAKEGDTCATVGPFDPADVIAAIRKAAGEETDESTPAPSKSPTADDFARAEFARHPDGRIAARVDPGDEAAWVLSRSPGDWTWLSDAEMAEEGWQIVTPAPTTARDLLAMLPGLCYEPEGDEIPSRAGYVVTRDGALTSLAPRGSVLPCRAEMGDYRYLLLDPPAPKRPEGAETIQDALVSIWPTDDLDGIEAAADHIAARVRVVPAEVEA